MRRSIPITLIALLMLVVPCRAHEFWIMPESFIADAPLRIRLFHGERFRGEIVPRNEPTIKRFELVTDQGTQPVRGLHGASVSVARPFTSGIGTIVFESNEHINLLDAAPFEAYLKEEGLDAIARLREESGTTDTPGREAYVRCAKAIVSPTPTANIVSKPVGLPLEITLDESVGGQIIARVLYADRPLENARVVAVSGLTPARLIELRTDAEGRVRFTPDAAGPWMLTTLHMERTPDRDDVDWKSYWGSLTFSLGTATR